jgi:hypothetical protein
MENGFVTLECRGFMGLAGRRSRLRNQVTGSTLGAGEGDAGFVSSSILIQRQNTPLREHPVTLPPPAKSVLGMNGEIRISNFDTNPKSES